jgi:segregation and condensation protein A
MEAETFTLENFEGPLDFLLHLIQKSELTITDIPIQQIMRQYLERIQSLQSCSVDQGAEFIGTAATLVWLKSRLLLPRHETEDQELEDLNDPRFEIIHLLLEYCQFKQTAKELTVKEAEQAANYPRGSQPLPEMEKGLGIDHFSMEDLFKLFQGVLVQASRKKKGEIHEEEFRVCDKISLMRSYFKKNIQLSFSELFKKEHCKEELIVTFLAILELMKNGEAKLMRDESGKIQFIPEVNEDERNQTNP